MMMHKNKSANAHQFAMVPKSDIPRSTFMQSQTHKTTIDAGYLVPLYLQEVLPGDSFNVNATIFARLSTPIFPVMDNMYLTTSFFFVPYRLIWTNWKKFMGEQANPSDSISYTIPQVVTPAGGYAIGALQDYMGLPTIGQMAGGATISHSTLPLRAYNLIYNEWYRDENLQNSVVVDTNDGPDTASNYVLLRRGKRKDYFTSALPWPQKGGQAVSLPLSGNARVIGDGYGGANLPAFTNGIIATALSSNATAAAQWNAGVIAPGGMYAASQDMGMYADLSTATATTINQLRQSIAIQQLLEKDARGGTRYTEIIRQQFGVVSPDARLQRPEYLGGADSAITINPIAQTSGTSATGTTTPLGNLGAVGAGLHKTNFKQSFTEHGIVIGLMSVRADLTYQQGLPRWWSRSTRYDFYTPVFANLGEQAVLNQEIYVKGNGASGDTNVFGYQERWAEYRYTPNMITGLFRSTAAGTIDPWHLAQKFTSLPTLNTTFIQDNPPVSRIVAVGSAANGQQFIVDSIFNNRAARPMPMYGVPGLKSL